MAIGTPIKQVEIGGDTHELLAKYIQDSNGNQKTWADIEAAASEAGIELVSLNALPEIPADPDEAAALYAEYRKSIVLIPSTNPGTQNIKDEYIIQRDGEVGSYTYRWEQIGSTEVDLSGYVQKGVTYTGAAQSNGAHTHTVTVPTISVDKTKKLGATATGTAVGASSTDTFVKSYPGATSKLVTTSVTGVDGSTTASKATAGVAVTVATRAGSQTTVGNANVGEAVSIPNVTGNTTVNATNIATPSVVTVKQVDTVTNGTAASFTQGAKAAWSANVDSNGVLSFSFTENGNDTFVANTPTAVSTANVTGVVKSGASTPLATAVTASSVTLGTAISVTPATASTTKIYGVGGTESITPYTFADVTVPVAADAATTVATGSLAANGSGASVMTGLGTAVTATAVTGVSVTAQPTITITEDTTNTGPVNEHVTTSTASATTSSDGAHTHDVNVAS